MKRLIFLCLILVLISGTLGLGDFDGLMLDLVCIISFLTVLYFGLNFILAENK